LPNRILAFSTRARLDENDFTLKRLEIEARANFDRWSVGVLYGQYAEQPSLGFLTRREGVLGSASWKIASNWVVTGGALYDLDAHKVAATMFGAGYVDDCFIMGVNYVTNYTYSGNPVTDHRVTLQIGLRTIGNSSLSQSVSGVQNIGSKLSSGY
jgi:LPS-assembly protein